jgi:hypothetical protein
MRAIAPLVRKHPDKTDDRVAVELHPDQIMEVHGISFRSAVHI